MRRLAEAHLSSWYRRSPRKPLIVRGARQVGKSTLVRQFAQQHGLTLHEVNLERHLKLGAAFESKQTARILREVEFVCKKGRIRDGESLLFLDEIQAVPSAIGALRYLYEDRSGLAVIAAGSLLEFALADAPFSMPVGRIEYLYIGPMTFQELCQGLGETDLLELLRTYDLSQTFPQSAHERLLELQRLFLLTGGMPEAVQRLCDTRDLDQVQMVQAAIVDTYRDDFAKYGSRRQLLRLQRIFDYVPLAVGEKLKYVNIDPNEQARELRAALDLLVMAQLLMKAHHTDASGIPLRATADPRVFKTFFLDCGLVAYAAGIRDLTTEQIQQRRFINEGKLAEQCVAQHLAYAGRPNERPELHYWLREGRRNNAELDFLLQLGSEILPVEVKAGSSGALKSLLSFAAQKGTVRALRFDLNLPSRQQIEHAVQLGGASRPVSLELLSLPLYMVEEARRLVTSSGAG